MGHHRELAEYECDYCGRSFQTTRYHDRFCSVDCSAKFNATPPVYNLTDAQLLKALRDDTTIGRGTRSNFDQFYDDDELLHYARMQYGNHSLPSILILMTLDAREWAAEWAPQTLARLFKSPALK